MDNKINRLEMEKFKNNSYYSGFYIEFLENSLRKVCAERDLLKKEVEKRSETDYAIGLAIRTILALSGSGNTGLINEHLVNLTTYIKEEAK